MTAPPDAPRGQAPLVFDLENRRDTVRFGRAISAAMPRGEWIALEGGLGVGKTFLTRAIARALGVPPSTRVTSPTFCLVSEYPLRDGVFAHADLFRLRGPSFVTEVERLGLGALLSDGARLVVEWAAGAEEALRGPPVLEVQLEYVSGSRRRARISGPHASAVVSAFQEETLRSVR